MDFRHWQRKGCFRPGPRFECQWSSDGKVVASVNVRTELGRVVLAYLQRGNDGLWQGMHIICAAQTAAQTAAPIASQNALKCTETTWNHLYFTTTYARSGPFVIGRSAVQVRSSAPSFQSLATVSHCTLSCCDVVCDVDFSDRWLREPNLTPDVGIAMRYAHPFGYITIARFPVASYAAVPNV
jgi:hypothetical protein